MLDRLEEAKYLGQGHPANFGDWLIENWPWMRGVIVAAAEVVDATDSEPYGGADLDRVEREGLAVRERRRRSVELLRDALDGNQSSSPEGSAE